MIIENKQAKDLKLAYIGGGSRGWAWILMNDLAKSADLAGTVYLYDIDFDAAKANEAIGEKFPGDNWHYKAVPEIGEALVFASEENGETFVKARIFPNLEYLKEKFGDKKPSDEEIKKAVQNAIKNVNSKIPNYKHIKIVEVLSSALEKTTTQKIKRFGKNVK